MVVVAAVVAVASAGKVEKEVSLGGHSAPLPSGLAYSEQTCHESESHERGLYG